MAMTKSFIDTTFAGKENSNEQVIFLSKYIIYIVMYLITL